MQENKPINIRLSDEDFRQFMEIYELLKENVSLLETICKKINP